MTKATDHLPAFAGSDNQVGIPAVTPALVEWRRLMGEYAYWKALPLEEQEQIDPDEKLVEDLDRRTSEATLSAWAIPATTWADVVLRGEIAEHWIDRASFEELIADVDDWTGMDLRSPAHLLRAVLDVGRATVPAAAPSQAGGSAPASAIGRLADEIARLE